MTLDLAGLLGGIATLLGVVYAGLRGLRSDRFNERVKQAAAEKAAFDDLVLKLQGETERLRKQHSAEMAEVRRIHAEDRETWASERQEMRDEIDELRSQVYALMRAQERSGQ